MGQEDDDQRVVSDGLGAAVKSVTLREERSVGKSEGVALTCPKERVYIDPAQIAR